MPIHGQVLIIQEIPQAYDKGDKSDQIFFGQHDAQWILTEDKEEAILVFNNGVGRGTGDNIYSSVDQIVVERASSGTYQIDGDGKFLPEKLDWTYKADQATDFYSQNISGTQRLENGNTLICNGSKGMFFEIDSSGEIVWEYTNKFSNSTLSINKSSPVFRVNRYSLDILNLK
ncbi:MAG: aryl-sulfate sulfotransferase [Acidaminobacteraceae bacterium]